MIVNHNRREALYKSPYGAVPTGQTVTLRVSVKPIEETIKEVKLHYAYGLYQFHNIDLRMKRADSPPGESADVLWYEHTLTMAGEPNLFFYWFEIQTERMKRWLIPDEHSILGTARLSQQDPGVRRDDTPISSVFRITVYDRQFQVAKWMRGGVMYQIFPDRFKRGKDYDEKKMDDLTSLHAERIWHRDWKEEVDIKGITEEGYLALDFYGGTLQGITEELDYLASLGITILYLNPIFKARSNHRYDTGDYETIDPMLGDTDDFIALCAEAKARGIRIILDGVFSHTGADSRYFNRHGRYPEVGAWQELTENRISPYSSWYRFEERGGSIFYDSWWGFKDLPNVNEYDLGYREYITGTNGILRKWMRLGASGWRLDVSDELPDQFIRAIRRAVMAESPEGVILGEIWEDASAKFSYGQYRDFIFGHTHDSVMGYPIQSALLSWLTHVISGKALINQVEILREFYPPDVFYANMTMLGTHDTPRAITVLSGDPDPGSRDAQRSLFLSETQRVTGERLLALGFLFLIAIPGTVSIFYGDEIGQEGYRDPYCRRTLDWDKVKKDEEVSGHGDDIGVGAPLLAIFKKLGTLRKSLPVLRTGFYRTLLVDADHLVIERYLTKEGRDAFDDSVPGPKRALIVLNRSDRPFDYRFDGVQMTIDPVGGLVLVDGEETFRL